MNDKLGDEMTAMFKQIEIDRSQQILSPDQIKRWSVIGGFGDTKQPLPSVKRIVNYWSRVANITYKAGIEMKEMPRFLDMLLIDRGECCCFGCEQFFGDSADKNDWTYAWTKAWKDGQIERCHVIPRSRGGSSRPRNLVLLCRRCHEKAPDVIKPEPILTFMENAHFDRMHRIAEDIVSACRSAGININQMAGLKLLVNSKEHADRWEDFESNYSTLHGFGIGLKRSTQIAAMVAYARTSGIDIDSLVW